MVFGCPLVFVWWLFYVFLLVVNELLLFAFVIVWCFLLICCWLFKCLLWICFGDCLWLFGDRVEISCCFVGDELCCVVWWFCVVLLAFGDLLLMRLWFCCVFLDWPVVAWWFDFFPWLMTRWWFFLLWVVVGLLILFWCFMIVCWFVCVRLVIRCWAVVDLLMKFRWFLLMSIGFWWFALWFVVDVLVICWWFVDDSRSFVCDCCWSLVNFHDVLAIDFVIRVLTCLCVVGACLLIHWRRLCFCCDCRWCVSRSFSDCIVFCWLHMTCLWFVGVCFVIVDDFVCELLLICFVMFWWCLVIRVDWFCDSFEMRCCFFLAFRFSIRLIQWYCVGD